MRFLIFVALCVVTLTRGPVSATLTYVVNTTQGPVQGEILETVEKKIQYAAFKGIPYAEPPTGYRRFRPPVAKQPWTSILLTTTEGNVCPQRNRMTGQFAGSEDCLYLNIYTPHVANITSDSKDLFPVMFWIHGGAYVTGHSDSSYYGPDFLIQEGIVVVTFNFRLGPLGFLSLNHENATGNAGLKDQNLALKWVKDNIIYFGGNPRSVTIFGHSSGASSVDLHVLSSMSRGLFYKSISMNGSPLSPWALIKPEDAVRGATILANKLGAKSAEKEDLLRILYDSSASDIVELAWQMGQDNAPFKPTVENTKLVIREEKFLTECVIKTYERGNYYKGPHLMGFSEQEALYLATSPEDLMSSAKLVLDTMKTMRIPSRISAKVFPVLSQNITNITSPAAMKIVNVLSDLIYITGIEAKQKYLISQNTYPVYYYRTTVGPEFSLHKAFQNIDIKGAAHSDDLNYIFYISQANPPLEANNTATIARKRFVRMWTNFAKYGTPTPRGRMEPLLKLTWPSSGISGRHLIIGEKLSVINRRPTDFPINGYRHLNVGLLVFRYMC